MERKILIIGTDSRQQKLAELYGISAISESNKSLTQKIQAAKIIILPIATPSQHLQSLISQNTHYGTIIIGGNIDESTEQAIFENGAEFFSILTDKEFAKANAQPTAKGAITIAQEKLMENNPSQNIKGSKILVLGHGKCGSIIAKSLADITQNIDTYDIIFNTIPQQILSHEQIQKANQNGTTFINIASDDAGFPPKNRYPNIPAKMFPQEAAQIMKTAIDKVIFSNKESSDNE